MKVRNIKHYKLQRRIWKPRTRQAAGITISAKSVLGITDNTGKLRVRFGVL